MKKHGQALIISLCILGLLILSLIPLGENVLINMKDHKIFMNKDKAFYLARAGLNMADWRIINEGWKGSDEEINLDENEIKNKLYTEDSILEHLGEGGYKYLKAIGKDEIYVMGFVGGDINSTISKIFIKRANNKWKIF